MNKGKIDLTKIVWSEKNPSLEEKDMHLLSQLPYPLPKRYIEFLKISNGGYLEKDAFDFYDEGPEYSDTLFAGEFCGLFKVKEGYKSIVYRHMDEKLPEFFVKGLSIFANPTGGGGLLCFDYRSDPKSNNPPVVFWSSGTNEGNDVFFLAKDFDAFLAMLHDNDEDWD